MKASSDTQFRSDVSSAMGSEQLIKALDHIRGPVVEARHRATEDLAEFDELRSLASNIREHSVANLDLYLQRFEQSVIASGGHVHWAANAHEARSIVGDLLVEKKASLVTKSKSMVTEEIDLNAEIERLGIEVVETDLGEYIVQIRNERPSHIIAPATHLSQEQIADDFRQHHKHLDATRDLSSAEVLLAEARELLRDKFIKADVGITGANFLIADTGQAVIVTNEGNADLTMSLPDCHILVTTIDRVVPDVASAMQLLRVLARSATGQEMSNYTTFVSGPRRSGDPDGPKELHVVLLDNGRSFMLGSPFQSMLKCIRCSACLNHCPIYQTIGGHAYGTIYMGPMGSVLSPAIDGLDKTAHLPNASTLCGRCSEVCPVKIPLHDLLRTWRQKEFVDGLTSNRMRFGLAIFGFVGRRPRLYRSLLQLSAFFGKLFARDGAVSWLPFGSGWTKQRDFAAPQGSTFQAAWQKSRRRGR